MSLEASRSHTRTVRPSAPAQLPWLPDQGNGCYRNPVLFADYSDPDAIRVGEDYWLTSSSFGHVPGLPILHSRDLVNWTLVNHALPQLVPVEHFSSPRHGQGVWAPAIRHHSGKFWIFYPDPDFGLYVVTTDDPRAAWSAPVLVKEGRGLIDPCPFWDHDGTGYLVHGWAKSRCGINNRVTLHHLRADGRGVTDAGQVIIDGDQLSDWDTIEGPKLYRRSGYYYVFAPAGGVAEGFQAVFRSRNLQGPYENRIVLARGSTAVNGPHQGAWIDTPEGSEWFLHFQEIPALGRVVHLQPLRWQDDWPVIGHVRDDDSPGEPVPGEHLPRARAIAPTGPATTDEFDAPALGHQWQWQANPQPDWALLAARPSRLRLRCVALQSGTSLWSAPHLLLQKFPAPEFEVTTTLDFAPQDEGDIAGLVVFGFSYACLGLRRTRDGQCTVVLLQCDNAHQNGIEREVVAHRWSERTIHLRVSVTTGGQCQFAFSKDGEEFSPIGGTFPARSSYWVGAKVGLFAAAAEERPHPGHADFDWFRVTPLTART